MSSVSDGSSRWEYLNNYMNFLKARLFYSNGNFESAIKNHHSCIKYFESFGQHNFVVSNNINLGLSFKKFNQT
jgi:hypothetical protein